MRHLTIVGSVTVDRLEGYYAAAFRSLGLQVALFDPETDPSLQVLRSGPVSNRLTWRMQHLWVGSALRRFMARQPPTDGVLVFKGYFLAQAALRAARELTPVPWVNLNPDSPLDPGRATSSRHIRESLPFYDAYVIWSQALLPKLLAAGCRRVEYLPFAYHPTEHFPAESMDDALAKTLVFVGSHDVHRARMLEALYDLPLRIYGNGWDRLPRKSPLRPLIVSAEINGAKLRTVTTSALASINLLRAQNAGAHNMRTFEVPAMGGLMVTTRSVEQQEFFPEGEASLAFADARELRSVSQRLLAGEVDTARLRQRATALSRGHSYRDRAARLVDLFEELRRTH